MSNVAKVVIVGGGTAGWMTAAYLSKALNKTIDITLVESPRLPKLGVGEATFSSIKSFFDFLGLQEQEWMPQCKATYKMAIKFVNWNSRKPIFFHPFESLDKVDGFAISEWWLKLKKSNGQFDYSCFKAPKLCDYKKSPKYFDGRIFDSRFQHLFDEQVDEQDERILTLADAEGVYPYAYHFDAHLLASFLRDYAIQRGVNHFINDVVDAKLKEDGSIQQIITQDNHSINGDLFVDCTGFRGLLINKFLDEPFISFSESLLCDRAIATQIPNNVKKNGINPYTTATALSSGWVWNIPLYGRDGTGYVYSSAFLSKDEAEQEFREHIGDRHGDCGVSHISMRIGRNRNSWVKNCVAIGVSSGFVEPLESTGIFFIQHAIEELVNYFSGKKLDEDLVDGYNKSIAKCIDGVRDFLTLHYHLSDRVDTPFWKANKYDLEIPEQLKENLRLWKKILPNKKNINPNFHGFESYSYTVMLLGLGHEPESNLPILEEMNSQKAIVKFNSIQEKANHLVATLPSHYEYLTHMASLSENKSFAISA